MLLARSDETVHYKCDETVNFCGFRCVTTSPITIFINFIFYILSINQRLTNSATESSRNVAEMSGTSSVGECIDETAESADEQLS